MTAAPFRTRITELFGIRLPIVAGGLQWLSDARYVAAAVDAGIMGFITAASFPTIPELRDEIRRCHDLTGGRPFGVNISMLPKVAADDRIEAVVDLVAEEGVAFVETSGRSPEAYLPRLRAAGVRVMHKVPAVKYALKAQALGVDAVAVVGAESGGHPGMEMVGTFVQAAVAAQSLGIPLVIGGGVGSGAHLIAALALGADGVIVGTRFLTAGEIWAHEDYKRRLVAADETSTTLILQSVRNTMRVLANETTAAVQGLERQGARLADLMPHIAGRISRQSYASGDVSRGALSVGQAVAFADRIEPLADIVARFEGEASAALARLQRLGAQREAAAV